MNKKYRENQIVRIWYYGEWIIARILPLFAVIEPDDLQAVILPKTEQPEPTTEGYQAVTLSRFKPRLKWHKAKPTGETIINHRYKIFLRKYPETDQDKIFIYEVSTPGLERQKYRKPCYHTNRLNMVKIGRKQAVEEWKNLFTGEEPPYYEVKFYLTLEGFLTKKPSWVDRAFLPFTGSALTWQTTPI